MNAMRVTRKEVAALVDATFPNYKGRKFTVNWNGRVTLADLNWHGGTRCQYHAATLDGHALGNTDRWNQTWVGDNIAEGVVLQIPSGICVVQHTIFGGTDMGLTIYVNPADMPRLLPDEAAEV